MIFNKDLYWQNHTHTSPNLFHPVRNSQSETFAKHRIKIKMKIMNEGVDRVPRRPNVHPRVIKSDRFRFGVKNIIAGHESISDEDENASRDQGNRLTELQ